MPRRRHDHSDLQVSLFPFLDALSGVIGVLALIICTIAALNMKNAKQVIEHPHDEKGKLPVYVECRAEGVLLHPEKIAIGLEQVRNSQTEWDARLRGIRSSYDQYLVLLVRPDGIETFHAAYEQARQHGIDVGYDALYAEGEIEIEPPAAARS